VDECYGCVGAQAVKLVCSEVKAVHKPSPAIERQGFLKVAISIGVSLRNPRSHSLRSGHALPVEANSLPKFGIASAKTALQ
jgi:hypothetical protein